eukprot:TRINITY_DN2445_c0_g1_i1.p1 TRINITY_DN2445_c0_g1~~TRINITY_DN2445_c0_g1_i1.p1  ORF type:complete len:349 (+),score=86.12 TRINITY_DN2445_c0_g1_i1:129-1175(+)
MNDRFGDLDALTSSDEDTSDIEEGDKEMNEFADDDDGEAAPDKAALASAELQGFFKDVEHIKDVMTEITANIGTIKGLYSELLTATSTEHAKELRDNVGEVRDRTNALAQEMRIKMKSMRIENDKFIKTHENDPSLVKIRSNMHGSLVRKFLDLMSEYQQVLSKYDQKIREKTYRQVQLGTQHTSTSARTNHHTPTIYKVSPDASPEDIDEMLDEGGDAAEQIFSAKIMEDRKHKNAKQTLDYLKEKQSDLHQLEKSIGELNQLFQDMAILVEAQGDLIDQIEYSVVQSKAYTEEAVTNLGRTVKIVNDTRRKKFMICVLCIIIIVILVVVVVVLSGVLPPVLTKLTG